MNFCSIDFETYYDDEYSVSLLGNSNYTNHHKFDAYLVSIYSPTTQFVGPPEQAPWGKLSEYIWVSHNSGFDSSVWLSLKKQGKIPKDTPPGRNWVCTADLSAFLTGGVRDLKSSSEILLGKKVDKSTRKNMNGKRWGDLSQIEKEEVIEYAKVDAKLSFEIAEKYLRLWPENEQKLSHHTVWMSRRGVRIDLELLKKYKEKLNTIIFESISQIPWGDKPLSMKKLYEYCRGVGIPAPKSISEDAEEYQQWESSWGDKHPVVKSMRRYRISNTLLKKLDRMELRIRLDETMEFPLKYFGTHTGRWSGDGGINLQNLPREPWEGVDLRRLLIPRPGYEFIICDLSQIEPRVLAWLVKDQQLLNHLREGISIYESHARSTMGWDGPRNSLKKEHPELYMLAKARVLGLGYGCGPRKFVWVAKSLAGLELSEAEAEKIVEDFRNSNPKIRLFWGKLQSDFIFGYNKNMRESGTPRSEIPLPSWRKLIYGDIKTSNKEWTCKFGLGGKVGKIYGAKLTENLVQAVARDVFAEALLRLHSKGVPVVGHVHDEVICEVPKGTDPREIQEIMNQPPPWAPDLPIASEAIISNHYCK